MSLTVNFPAKVLYGIQAQGPSSFNNVEGSGADFSKQLWFTFIDKLVELNIAFDGDLYGVSWPADDHTPPQEVHYFCGLESAEPIDGLQSLELTDGNYFEHRCDVPASHVDQAFDDAYMRAFPNSGLIGRDGQHIEIYGDEYDPESERAKFRILIPVQ